MDTFADERDNALLECDRCTFYVLRRVMTGSCRLLLTDHERLIICYTGAPFPVWIWLPDGASEAENERAYDLAEEHCLFDGTHTLNLKYSTAEYFIRRAAADGKTLAVKMNMLAYECPEPKAPEVPAEGGIRQLTADDITELAEILELFAAETGTDLAGSGGFLPRAEEYLSERQVFCWQDAAGNSAAYCMLGRNGNMASVNLVYTRPEFRRRHFAENLVYGVTKLALGSGLLPALYTNADYAASNACYMKIGYVSKGSLCTIGTPET